MIDPASYAELIRLALAEDLGAAGDITSQACVPEETRSRALIAARAPGVLAGVEVAANVFAAVDPATEVEVYLADGELLTPPAVIAEVEGSARSLLAAERTALNILSRMSGVATATAALVALVEGTGTRITDTRKTMPGMRSLDKHAVQAGGGVNHRMGLYDAVMIKDNHIAATGGIAPAVTAARSRYGPGMAIIVEVADLDQLGEAMGTDADRILLDNMTPEMLAAAVGIVGGSKATEASGGVTMDNVREIAETGVDFISVGWITHSAPQVDIALDFAP